MTSPYTLVELGTTCVNPDRLRQLTFGYSRVPLIIHISSTVLRRYALRFVRWQRKGGGVRPIAVGSTLRRLVAEAACQYLKDVVVAKLAPSQLGFGVGPIYLSVQRRQHTLLVVS